jgi:CBS-domain-containing membrane protein
MVRPASAGLEVFNRHQLRDEQMTARLIMDPNPSVLNEEAPIREAVKIIMEHRYRNIPIVDDRGCYLGVFGVNCLLRFVLPKAVLLEGGLTTVPFINDTLADLRRRLAEKEDQPVSSCVSGDSAIVEPDTPLVETLLILYRTRNSVAVVDPNDGCLVGMISYWDAGEKIMQQEV